MLCYAFDVYRRGWQYFGSIGNTDSSAIYFSHMIRDDAFDAINKAWENMEFCQNNLWSWGEYLIRILESPEYGKTFSVSMIFDKILALQQIIGSGFPRWHYINISGDYNSESFQSYLIIEKQKMNRPQMRLNCHYYQ